MLLNMFISLTCLSLDTYIGVNFVLLQLQFFESVSSFSTEIDKK